MSGDGTRGRILVIGGGISGITAAIEAAQMGVEVVLVEREAFLGGRVARLHQYFPKLCPPACGLEINLRAVRTNARIRCLTLSRVESITGTPGRYHATIGQDPRFVTEQCTACGACADVCPAQRSDAFNYGMATTRAAYLPFEWAYPFRFAIDAGACLGATCGKCVPACPYGAIDLTMAPETVEVDVQAVVWATGWDPPDATRFEGLAFGQHADVITNVMMERLATPTGPTAGRILRPSDGGEIRSIAFVQCAGSRDDNYLRHCSGVCCMATLKQARYVREQYPEAQIYVFYIDLRSPGRFEDFYAAAQKDERLKLVRGKVARITGEHGALQVEAEDTLSGRRVHQQVDMVVLATGMVPAGTGYTRLEGGLERDQYGFLSGNEQSAMLVAGCARRPNDVAACVRNATGAVAKALQFCLESELGQESGGIHLPGLRDLGGARSGGAARAGRG